MPGLQKTCLLFAGLFFVSLVSCKSKTEDSILARVNNETIDKEEFQTRLSEYRVGANQPLAPSPEDVTIKKDLLNEMIEEKVMNNEAQRRKLSISSDELDNVMRDLAKDYPNESLNEQLKTQKISRARFRERLRLQMLRKKLVQDVTKDVRNPPPQEIEKYYNEHLDEFRKEELMHVRQIVVKSEKDAEAVLDEIDNGKPFEELARIHSFTPEASQGGELGWIPKGVMPKEVDAALAKLPVGEVSDAITSEYGVHILELLEKKKATLQTLEEASPTIISKLTEKERETRFAQWRKEALSKAHVERNHALLARIL